MSKTRGGGKLNNIIDNGISLPFIIISILLFIVIGLLVYIVSFSKNTEKPPSYLTPNTTVVEINKQTPDKFNDPYSPPLKNDGLFFPIDDGNIKGGTSYEIGALVDGDKIPTRSINIQTRGYSSNFTQIGILTCETKTTHEPKILPLMGRRVMNGRDKYQYYTISNSGNVNTKLPISKEGRNCINEYGCDQLYSGDIVFVEGYEERFKITVYENELFRYIP
jgi:hypothetical protein